MREILRKKNSSVSGLRFLLLLVLLGFQAFPTGQSAVITLVFPTGARSLGMGGLGTALADDEDVAFYNPAGLGIFNDRWRRGAVTEFYEPLLPAFKIPDLWHHNMAWLYQPSSEYVGGFAAFWNYINFGINEWTNEMGAAIGQARSYEWVFDFSYGLNFKLIGLQNHSLGLSFKYANSALAPGYGPNDEGTGETFAFDFGYLWQIHPTLRFGLTLQNMGPSIYYISQDERDPIPFTVNLALGYKNDFIINNAPFAQVRAEFRADREVVKNYINGKPDPFWRAVSTDLLHDTSETFQQELDQINWHFGGEFTLYNTVSVRNGFLLDKMGKRYEQAWGFGFRLLNHFQFDWAKIISPEGYMKGIFDHEGANGSRDGQWGISFTYFRMFDWSKNDRTWWKQNP